MTDEGPKSFYVRYVDAANARDFGVIGELIHDRVMINGAWHTREDVVASLKEIADAVPDFKWHIEELFTDDGGIVARLHDTGTPARLWLGLPPTGAAVDFTEYASYRVRDGWFVEMRFLMDVPTITKQLWV